MKCGVCKGRKTLDAGNGVKVRCTGCKGLGTVTMTLAERMLAKQARKTADERAAAAPKALRFVIDGHPVPKGRPRFAGRPGKEGRVVFRTYTPEETEAYEEKVRLVADAAVRHAGWCWSKDDRFHVLITVFREHYDAGGDIDNYEKAILDAMNKVVYADDRYVRGKGTTFADPTPRERVVVEVRRFPRAS